MGVIEQLARSLNRRDEKPNEELAQKIAASKNAEAIDELVDNLFNKQTAIQNDCIKVLYEIGAITPKLIAKYANTFIQLLEHKNNRMQWGAMTALSAIIYENPKALYEALPKIINTADHGSVITKDNAINILIGLSSMKSYHSQAFSALLTQLEKAPPNQLPMYAEKSLPVISKDNREAFLQTLRARMDDFEKDSQKRRMEKVFTRANKKK